MASLFKPTYTKTDKKTGKKLRRKTRKWYGQFNDADGRLQRKPLSTDKAVTLQMLNQLVKKIDLERVGICDPYEHHRKTPLKEHLDDFQQHLLDKGNTPDYCSLKANRTRRLMLGCGFRFIDDISSSRVQHYVAELQRDGTSIQTGNFYLQAAKQFCRWMVQDRRYGENPLAHLQGGNVKLDRRHDRREVNDDELCRLLAVTHDGEVRNGLCGVDRYMLYLMALGTGLRASELASLIPESFELDNLPITVKVKAAYAKNRREDVVPLPPSLLEPLKFGLQARVQMNAFGRGIGRRTNMAERCLNTTSKSPAYATETQMVAWQTSMRCGTHICLVLGVQEQVRK